MSDLEGLTIHDDCSSSEAARSSSACCGDRGVVDPASDVSSADKENSGVERGGQQLRSRPLDAAVPTDPPPMVDAGGGTQSKSAATREPPEEQERAAGQLSAALATLVQQRTAVLFPAGSTRPAAKPTQPPVVEKPTRGLCDLVFAASGSVQLTRGQLARKEAAACVFADLLGRELLETEALRLGENVRKAAAALAAGVKAKEKAASAKASRMRAAAAKDPERAARLDRELQELEAATAAACALLRQEEATPAGLPARDTVIMERRAPPRAVAQQAPVEHAPAVPADICPHARAMRDAATSQEAGVVILAAFHARGIELRASDVHCNEELEVAQVRYRHALRRLQDAYPGMFCDYSSRSWDDFVHFAAKMVALGEHMPIAHAAARKSGLDLDALVHAYREDIREYQEMRARDNAVS